MRERIRNILIISLYGNKKAATLQGNNQRYYHFHLRNEEFGRRKGQGKDTEID